jgi:hypothetical protein
LLRFPSNLLPLEIFRLGYDTLQVLKAFLILQDSKRRF